MSRKTKIAFLGCGAIGEGVSCFVNEKLSKKTKISGLADLDESKALKLQQKLTPAPKIQSIEALVKSSDLIVEAACHQAAIEL